MSTDRISIEVNVPACALETLQGWAEKSGLGQERFYTTALEMGVSILDSSLGYLDDLSPGTLEEAARELGDDEMLAALEDDGERLSQEMLAYSQRAAAQSVTPASLAQILLGEQAKAAGVDLGLVTVPVEYPDERAKEARRLAEKSGMGSEDLFALAFATGARLMAYTLSPSSFFSPETVARAMGRSRRKRGGTAGSK